MKSPDPKVRMIISSCFGQWIISLWSVISFQNRELSFSAQKSAFFEVLTTLLDNGDVKFVKPDADVYYNATINPDPALTINDPQAHWDVTTEEIMRYLKSKWPEAATDRNDLSLNSYFYEIPAIIWKGEDGKWYGS